MSRGADPGAPGQADRRPAGSTPRPGQRTLVAVIVLTVLVMLFAAAVAIWMYWLQGALPA